MGGRERDGGGRGGVDGAFFSTLRVGAAIGRVIQGVDDAGGARVVVLSHTLWRTRFAADPAIVRPTVEIAEQGGL